jgi:predicted PurR-regulated permease PerM
MEVVYFVLGIVTVLLVIGVVVVVRVSTQVRTLQEELVHFKSETHSIFEDVHRRMDNEMRDVYSQLDSRLDKLESRINRQKTQVPKG